MGSPIGDACSTTIRAPRSNATFPTIRVTLRIAILAAIFTARGFIGLASDGRSQIVRTARGETENFLHIDGYTLPYTRLTGPGVSASASAPAVPDVLTAPMPGAVTEILVQPGDTVVRGQPLVIIEAMKMEHVIRAPRAGSIRAVHAHRGDQVDGGVVMVEMTGSADEAPR